jgi:hypothetical protein
MSDQETTEEAVIDTPATVAMIGEHDTVFEQIFADQFADQVAADAPAPDPEAEGVESEEPAPSPDSTPGITETLSEAESTEEDQPAPGSADPQELEVEGGEGDEGTPTAPAPITFRGIEITEDQMEAMVNVHNWATSLPDAQKDQINALLSGQYELVPRGTTPPAAAPASSGVPSPTPDEDYLDPAVARDIAAMNERVAAMEAQAATYAQAQHREMEQQRIQAIAAGQAAIRDKFSLSDAELEQLIASTTQAQIIPALAAQYPNDPLKAFTTALETTYFSNPTFQQREVQRRMDEASAQAEQVAAKRRKAASLAGSSAPVPREEKPLTALTPDQAQLSMIEELKAAMNGSGS